MASASKGPNVPAIPPPPAGDWWDETQWSVFFSLLDAFLAPTAAADDPLISAPGQSPGTSQPTDSLTFNRTTVKTLPRPDIDAAVAKARSSMKDAPDAALVTSMLAARASDDSEFVAVVKRSVASLSPKTQQSMGGLLTILSGRVGAYLFTGYCTPIQQQPVHVREAILQGWTRSWIPVLRVVARSLSALAQSTWVMASPHFRQTSGYREAPANWQPGPSFDYKFLQFERATPTSPDNGIETLEADVVIVGSGCGGAVCAQVLAAAGYRVIVVEKAYHFPTSQLPMPQTQGTQLLYENGTIVGTTNPSLSVLAGSTWGGGGTINWSVSLRTPDEVRAEWAADDQPGMAFIKSKSFDASMDRVMDFMGINDEAGAAGAVGSPKKDEDEDEQSHRGRVILDGAAKLKFEAAPLLQNAKGGKAHDDGYCHLGCASAAKQGTSVSWLPAAAKSGARFIEGFHVERILFDGDDGTAEGNATTSVPHSSAFSDDVPQAIGVVGTWLSRDANGGVAAPEEERTKRRVVIKAKKVVVSGGSLNSPVLLIKSGLQNPQIGKNLHLHPCTLVVAYHDEDTKPMDKGIITSICTSFQDLDGAYHGPRIEAMCMVPYAVLANLPWRSGLDFKLASMRFRHANGYIALTRDRDSGRVFSDPATGQPIVDYTPSMLDREHATEGAIGIARLSHASGANEIRVFVAGTEPWTRDSGDDFEAWTESVRAAGLSASPLWGGWSAASAVGSAHQMGTCRMGDDAGTASVVDPRGRVWGTRGLYVADASVFPSASGVNPMVTVMALADHIANGIARDLAET